MSGGQRSGWDRPAAATRRYGYRVLSPEATCSAPWPLAVGRLGTHPPPALTNPSCFCSPHLLSGTGLDPGIWGKGHLGPEGGWGRGEGANQPRHILLTFF